MINTGKINVQKIETGKDSGEIRTGKIQTDAFYSRSKRKEPQRSQQQRNIHSPKAAGGVAGNPASFPGFIVVDGVAFHVTANGQIGKEVE